VPERHVLLAWRLAAEARCEHTRGYDRNITSPRTLLRMIDYLHENPLRKKLVADPQAWHWSSARHYMGGSSPIAIDPIPPEWLEVEK